MFISDSLLSKPSGNPAVFALKDWPFPSPLAEGLALSGMKLYKKLIILKL
jgi:hypothetical protein